MKTMLLSKIALCLTLSLVLATGCKKKDNDVSSDPKVAIVGKWHQDKSVIVSTPITGVSGGKSGTETYTFKYDNWITFNANGTYTANGKDDDGTPNNESGSYSVSGNKLTVTGETISWDITTLTSSNLVIKAQGSYDENSDGVNDTNETVTTYFSK